MYQEMEWQAQAQADVDAQTLENEQDTKAFEAGTRLYTCQNCGAQIIAEAETSATFCYYCHAPVVLAGRLSGAYCPAYVLPFVVPREKAIEQMQAWCKKHWFLPKSFTSEKQLEKLTGVYVPFWLFDCDADAHIQGIGKKVRTWREGDYEVTETEEWFVERGAVFPFSKVPADGAQKIEDALMDAIEPFGFQQLKPFSMQYLSGFMAQKYDHNHKEVLPHVQQRVEQKCIQILRSSVIGYSAFIPSEQRAVMQHIRHDYVLLPVWFLHYTYRGKSYQFAMNGQSGRLAGTPPLSIAKALLASAIGAVLVFLLVLLLGGWIFL